MLNKLEERVHFKLADNWEMWLHKTQLVHGCKICIKFFEGGSVPVSIKKIKARFSLTDPKIDNSVHILWENKQVHGTTFIFGSISPGLEKLIPSRNLP